MSRRGLVGFAAVLGAALGLGQLAAQRAAELERGAAPGVSRGGEPSGSRAVADRVSPTGTPLGVDCEAARDVVAQIHERFAAPIVEPAPDRFAELVAGWLDPHGLWSASSDAPPAALIAERSRALLGEIQPHASEACAAADDVGRELARWVAELRSVFDRNFDAAPTLTLGRAGALGLETVFDDGVVLVPARELAHTLGHHLGALEKSYGHALAPYAAVGRARYFPELSAREWRGIVLAAALRGYVAAIDPHGQWAPLDEEWSLYSGDPSFDDSGWVWGDMVRTALGARIVDRPETPLEVDDLVIAIDGVPLAGLSVEQAEMLARSAPPEAGGAARRRVVVLRQGDDSPREVELGLHEREPDVRELARAAEDEELEVVTVRYAHGYVAVVSVPYVDDELGERLMDVVKTLAQADAPLGMLLDLRGNGGGSMDGATRALATFLPGTPVFTLLQGGRVAESLETPGLDPSSTFRGPVAALVDGATASAAEMIAGALDRYGRGVVVGQPTFGKGCVQEYFPDRAGAGVLRLTTRLFALPDGTPVQGRGVSPSLLLDLPEPPEHEADLAGALGPVAGPDIRARVAAGPTWPPSAGRVGPCEDLTICESLRALGRPPGVASRREHSGKGRLRADSPRH